VIEVTKIVYALCLTVALCWILTLATVIYAIHETGGNVEVNKELEVKVGLPL